MLVVSIAPHPARAFANRTQRLKRVDVRFERQRRVERLLDARLAVVLDCLTDLSRVRRCLLDDLVADLLLALLEQRVVLGEICMAEHVRGDERVLLERVVPGEIGSTWVAREHDLEES